MNSIQKPAPKGIPMGEADRERLRAVVERDGEHAAARTLSIARLTLARCIAGLPVHRATKECVSRRLQEMG